MITLCHYCSFFLFSANSIEHSSANRQSKLRNSIELLLGYALCGLKDIISIVLSLQNPTIWLVHMSAIYDQIASFWAINRIPWKLCHQFTNQPIRLETCWFPVTFQPIKSKNQRNPFQSYWKRKTAIFAEEIFPGGFASIFKCKSWQKLWKKISNSFQIVKSVFLNKGTWAIFHQKDQKQW